jgi:hypothetical protein
MSPILNVTMIIGITVRTWHQNEVTLSAELIDSFVKGVERQAAESAIRYEAEKESHILEDVGSEGEENYVRAVEAHRGLDSETWDLAGIFTEYFPSLQRRSALLTVWGYFEHELDKLCALYEAEKGFRLDLSDLNGRGIDRSTAYLEKVVGLNVHKTSQEWNRIKKIQKVRNIVAHQDGRLADRSGVPEQAVLSYIDEMESLGRNGEVTIKEGFLASVVDTFKSYFKLIGDSIAANEGA